MPEPYRSFTSKVVPLPADNVDTDQCVPARFLKITDKAGLADALFRDWRVNEDGALQVPPIAVDPEPHAHRFALVDDDPDSELTVDLAEGGVLLPDGTTVEFDVDTFAKLMLLGGTDAVAYLLPKLP